MTMGTDLRLSLTHLFRPCTRAAGEAYLRPGPARGHLRGHPPCGHAESGDSTPTGMCELMPAPLATPSQAPLRPVEQCRGRFAGEAMF